MAKLKAPLMSLGASGALGKALVFFGWKGLDVVREYVIPANPKTSGQTTQRGYLTFMVTEIHSAQAHTLYPLIAIDISAYALWGSIFATPRTWFNQVCKNGIDQQVASKIPIVYTQGQNVPGVNSLHVYLRMLSNTATAGNFWYGTSKTALIHSKAATVAGNALDCDITGLVTGVKYYWQFKPTAAATRIGANSGIYYGTPT